MEETPDRKRVNRVEARAENRSRSRGRDGEACPRAEARAEKRVPEQRPGWGSSPGTEAGMGQRGPEWRPGWGSVSQSGGRDGAACPRAEA
eukprot:g12845.t1